MKCKSVNSKEGVPFSVNYLQHLFVHVHLCMSEYYLSHSLHPTIHQPIYCSPINWHMHPTTHYLAHLFNHSFTYQYTSLISSSNYPSSIRFTYEFIVRFALPSIHALFINTSTQTFIHPFIHSSTYSRVFSSFNNLHSPSIYGSCFSVPLVANNSLKLLQPMAFRIKNLRESIN